MNMNEWLLNVGEFLDLLYEKWQTDAMLLYF